MFNLFFRKKSENGRKEEVSKIILQMEEHYQNEERLKKEIPSGARFSINIDDFISKFEAWDEVYFKKSFQYCLLRAIDESGMTYPQFYRRAHIDRKLFSAIKNNEKYQPSKDTVIQCCLALNLKMVDAKDLMRRAGYSFSLSIKRDRVIYYCIENEIYDIMLVNDVLYELGEKCLAY